jgi:hypothetical protein
MTKDTHLCVPVLKRYDLFALMIRSLETSTLRPTVHVIDNGRSPERLVVRTSSLHIHVHVPSVPLGVASSWNWFLENVPEERIISNDDVIFSHDSLQKMAETLGDLVWAEGCGFSCFLIRDTCIEKLGKFDETISPGYGYYEDEDYLQRLDGRGTRAASAIAANVDCGVRHLRSQTLYASSIAEQHEHHRKFKIAQQNYARKWNVVL